MIAACPAPDPAAPLVRGLLQTVDCGVQVFAQSGYQALTQPPSPFPAIVTAALTLYVALLGWGMLSGRGPRLADTPQLAVKVGVILALVASWPLFQALVFRTAFEGPAQFAAVLISPLGAPGGPNVWANLQIAYDQIVLIATALGAAAGPDPDMLRGGAGATSETLWAASAAMMAGTLGVVLVAKIVAGVLTATGPIFIALFLMDVTRGLFVGWLRALLTTALVPMVAICGAALLLALLEPRLALLVALHAKGESDLGMVAGVSTLIFVFVAAQACLILAMAVAGLSFHLRPLAERQPMEAAAQPAVAAPAPVETARAVAVAEAVRRMDVRERSNSTTETVRRQETGGAEAQRSEAAGERRLGQTHRRMRGPLAQPRRSA